VLLRQPDLTSVTSPLVGRTGRSRDGNRTRYTGPTQPSPVYFPVSATKLVVLSLCSFGLYELYWFYQHWKLERARTGENIWPFWRALLAPIFAYSLFSRIQDYGSQQSVHVDYSAGGLATAFFVLQASWRLPEPYWLVSMLTLVPLLPVRSLVAAINSTHVPQASTNGKVFDSQCHPRHRRRSLVAVGGRRIVPTRRGIVNPPIRARHEVHR